MIEQKKEGFTPEVWIYVCGDKRKVLYTQKGFYYNIGDTKDVYIRIAGILINTKLPVECVFWVGFYFDDFSVGIERIGDLCFKENSMEIFQLDPSKVIINVRNELIRFLNARASEFEKEAEALQKEASKKNKQFSRYFSVVHRLIMADL